MARPGELDLEDIAFRILIATQNAVKNLEGLNAKLDEFTVKMNKAKQAQAQVNSALNSMGGMVSKTGNSVNNLNNSLGQVPKHATPASKGLWSLNNVLRTALGTLEAMAIFLVVRFVGQAISKSIEGIKQLELALYNLAVAEKTLSRAGIEITPQDFQEIIQSVKDLGLAISDTDITKGVADLATGLQDLGLSKEQLEGLSRAAAIIAMSEGLTMENVADQFAKGIAKGGKGLADLDIQVDAAVIKQKALDEQLVASEAAWDNLTAAQRQSIETQALYLIILDSANTKLEEMGLLEDSVTQTTKETSAEWENLTTLIGSTFKPIIVQAAKSLTWLLEILQMSVAGLGILFATYTAGVAAMAVVNKQFWEGNISSAEEARKVFQEAFKIGQEMMLVQMFPTGIPGIESPWVKDSPDTPTGTKKDANLENQEDLQKALDKMNEEILEAQIRLAQDMEDAAIDLGRKLVDIAIEYARKRAEAEIDYANTIRDINAAYREKIRDSRNDEAEAVAKARNDELEREAEFQNKLLELKERYLMDLEEALHERDARQVIRLMKQYNLDKTQAERDRQLERESSARDLQEQKRKFARERADAAAERNAKLAEAAQEYQDKLAKLARDEEAERQAAELAYQRKMEDLDRELKNRLELIGARLVDEFNLTKQGLDRIYALYKAYYGEFARMYASMNRMLSGSGISPPSGGGSGGGGTGGGHRAMAEGGTIIADRPTTVTFGEGGVPEIGQFTPIGKNGRDVNKLFSNLSNGGEGSNSAVEIGVTLSPDLEARVIKKSSDHMANIITKIRGSNKVR